MLLLLLASFCQSRTISNNFLPFSSIDRHEIEWFVSNLSFLIYKFASQVLTLISFLLGGQRKVVMYGCQLGPFTHKGKSEIQKSIFELQSKS